jgi:hypothetical protein
MANFAKIGLDNIVLDVQLIDNINSMTPEGVELESIGCDFLSKIFKHQTWLKTSYNTRGGIHINGGTPFRKNYAMIGGRYDSVLDAFIPPQPYASWILDEETCLWNAPTPYPTDGENYTWDEATISWLPV